MGAGGNHDRESERGKEFVSAIARAMVVLEAFEPHRPDMTLSEVAARTGFTPATVRRCLNTFEATGHIRRSGRHFRLGPRILSLALGYTARFDMEELAGRELELLVERFDDPASVAVLDGNDVVYVATIARPSTLRPSARVGTRYPCHATSLGKVLLAFSPPETRERYLSRTGLEAPTDRTIADPARLRATLDETARNGFAISIDELDYGVAALAVPIRDATGTVVAAINSSAYSARITPQSLIADRLGLLQDCARAISGRLAGDAVRMPG
jgi:IclR family transcriptional regulator, pca regulon regulatory protein